MTGTLLMSTAVLTVAACSNGGATGTFPGSSSASARSASTGERAPAVPAPLDPGNLVDHPCASLTAEQSDQLGIGGQGTEQNVGIGTIKTCDWKFGANLEWKIQVAYAIPDTKNGIQNVYDQDAAGTFDGGYFEPTSVDGYPGVFNGMADTRPQGRCDLSVGINDEMLLTVAVTGQADKDNCKATTNVAQRIISTIKTGER
ncbi:DUF3558 family protein [Amycolatopsis thermophila]|uniref:DUF3558 domain-containing protein n=1 Tax=Amycolatopsis thermophila TaxID=206084 RepID=A0ABU0EV75_9PSEU|nr:DUF3558 family protein [Amycolatopsis thermophila]MDQ0378998.1 hypothetical protein [Amycolatopsis thermophila]